jgi:hypothetical protein
MNNEEIMSATEILMSPVVGELRKPGPLLSAVSAATVIDLAIACGYLW